LQQTAALFNAAVREVMRGNAGAASGRYGPVCLQKAPFPHLSAVHNPDFHDFAAMGGQTVAGLSLAGHSESLKSPLDNGLYWPGEMLRAGYNAIEMAPYLYEGKARSTTIALHWEVARVSNRCMYWC
jgi:hypothetical protein